MTRGALALWIGLLGAASLPGCRGAPPAQAPAPAAGTIAWQPWGAEAFARAKREGKLVMVDVGIEGCTACRWMHTETYRSAAVTSRIARSFVPVSVDADTQPDLGQRYEAWGWPATIFLNGDGKQVHALRGSTGADELAGLLDRLAKAKHDGAPLPPRAREEPRAGDLESTCHDARRRLAAFGNRHGWGHVAYAPPVQHALLRAHAHGDDILRVQALAALAGQSKILDPVWGGVYVAATGDDWSSPIVEKRTVHEAHALMSFAEGHHATGDARWLTAATSVHTYLRDWMTAPDGTFYSTQEDDAPHLPPGMSASDYYRLPDVERRKHGTPPVNHGVFTDQNGATIAAYARLYEATGDHAMLDVATRAADVLLKDRLTPTGTFVQFRAADAVRQDRRLRGIVEDGRPYLNAQAEMGLALVALAGVTGDHRWLDASTKLAEATRAQLEDAQSGGFFATSASSTDALVERDKPFTDNMQMGRFLVKLSVLTKNPELRAVAEKTVRAVATPSEVSDLGMWAAGPYALLLEELAAEPIVFTVVTAKPDLRADALFAAALAVYEPRKAVRRDAPGTYPDRGKPALYVCTKSACSSPVFDPRDLAVAARSFVNDKTRGCSP